MLIPAIALITGKSDFEEFKILAEEAGYAIIGIVKVRNLREKGLSEYKINELKEKIMTAKCQEIICDTNLKPKQVYNIVKETRVGLKDRIEIILEIFKKHSPSEEADLQIKLASLKYELARAKEKVRLAKMGEQPGFYGLGSYEVDVYYNEIKRRIINIERKLGSIRRKRELHRRMRVKRGYKTVAIVGYTCTGKSSLFNTLTGASVKIGPEPFTTLSTKFSTLKLGPWRCYLIDTIGFIQDLPPFMISAFYSTLEEVAFADLILLMIDLSEGINSIINKLDTSLQIIEDLGYRNKPIIIVGNKIDLLSNSQLKNILSIISNKYEYSIVPISALYKINIENLIEKIAKHLGKLYMINILLPYDTSYNEVISKLKKFGALNDIYHYPKSISINGYLPYEYVKPMREMIKRLGGKVRIERHMGPSTFS